MAQNKTIMAFRKRLKNAGYTEITIYKIYKNGKWTNEYEIQANEPLGDTRIKIKLHEIDLHKKFR